MKLLMLCALLCAQTLGFANNIRVKKLSLTDTVRSSKTVNIKFDLSWENSWRDDINWDAAWVFAKVKTTNGIWKHIKLSLSGNTIDSNAVNAKIVVPTDRMGAYVYRSNNGSGTISMQGIRFTWNYGQDSVNIDSAEVRVFATEMVYVPKGGFAFGSAHTGNSVPYGVLVPELLKNFKPADTSVYGINIPMYTYISDKVTSRLVYYDPSNSYWKDSALANGIYISGSKGISKRDTTVFNYPNFPVGYQAFYSMKYEVSQGQYTDFLNTTIRDSASIGWLLPLPNFNNTSLSRMSVGYQRGVFTVTHPDWAMNYIKDEHALAFAVWSGLRPMTELEYEKACRGPIAPSMKSSENSSVFDFASGSYEYLYVYPTSTGGNGNYNLRLGPVGANSLAMPFMNISGPENGTETVTNMDSSMILRPVNTLSGGDGGSNGMVNGSPYRVGIFATHNSNRASSGASYYGIMGLTDNLEEKVVSINSEQSRSFNGSNGNGEIRDREVFLSRWVGNTSNYAMPNTSIFINKYYSVSDRNSYSSFDGTGFRLVRSALLAENQ